MKYCTNCGSEVKESDSFCVSCGSPIAHINEPVKTESSADSLFGFDDQPKSTINETNTYNSSQPQNTAEPEKTNSMCLAGFILSIFFSFIGLIVSCVGLSQLKKNPNEKGRGFAVAGIVIGIIGTVIYIISFAVRFVNVMGRIQ